MATLKGIIREQLYRTKVELGLTNTSEYDVLLKFYIEDAIKEINKARRFVPTEDIPIEEQYYSLISDICVARFNKRGAEGETAHSENGTGRSYENASPFPPSLLGRVIPLAKGVVSTNENNGKI